MKKFEVHVTVEHWMYVSAESKEEAVQLAAEAVESETSAVSDTESISEDEVEICYASLCMEI